jgi:deoxyribonuclease-2
MSNLQTALSAISDNGQPIDWWFLYKVAGKSITSNDSKAKGTEYVYFDSDNVTGEKLTLSPFQIDDPKQGAVSNTLNQIYNNPTDPNLGWFFYNDEDPITDKTNGDRGHTKGALCFNMATNSGFWLIHSAPKFTLKESYGFPETATGNAQTFLCITLKDADTAKAIAAQMYIGQQPNVYLASKIPNTLSNTDSRTNLIRDIVSTDETSYANFISFQSKAGQTFRCIAKNKHWNTVNDDDFYNDLVGAVLAESLEVETWEHDPVPNSIDNDKVHNINAMKAVDLAPLNISPSYEWSEENDHAKLAISDETEAIKYVCVGDLNFTVAQEKRSGGTVAFNCDALWQSLFEILDPSSITPLNQKTARTEAVVS